MSDLFEQDGVTVYFGERFARSGQFDAIFQQGMQLVERTAEYLDREGRKESKKLGRPVSVAYATESMRLTTRLLDLASWLLVQRSLKEGEISREEALSRREGMRLRPFSRPSHIAHFDALPEGLQALCSRGNRSSIRKVTKTAPLRASGPSGRTNGRGSRSSSSARIASSPAANSGRPATARRRASGTVFISPCSTAGRRRSRGDLADVAATPSTGFGDRTQRCRRRGTVSACR